MIKKIKEVSGFSSEEIQHLKKIYEDLKKKNTPKDEIKIILKREIEKLKRKKERKKKIIKYCIMVGIIVILIILGFIFFRTQSNVRSSLNPQPKTSAITNPYHEIPQEVLQKVEKPKDYIKFRFIHAICNKLQDPSCFINGSPIEYNRLENGFYKVYLIRVENDDLTDVKVYYKNENEKQYRVIDVDFKVIDYGKGTLGKRGNVLLNLELERGKYCFYIEAHNSEEKKVKSDIYCKTIGSFNILEDKFDVYRWGDFNTLLLSDRHLTNITEVIKQIEQLNGKLIVVDGKNKKFEFSPTQLYVFQQIESNSKIFNESILNDKIGSKEVINLISKSILIQLNSNFELKGLKVYLEYENKMKDLTRNVDIFKIKKSIS